MASVLPNIFSPLKNETGTRNNLRKSKTCPLQDVPARRFQQTVIRLTAVLVMLLLTESPGWSAPDEDGIRFFEEKIRPVLVQECYSCHSIEARDQKKLQADLFLDSAEGIATGGESGAILIKGDSANSVLLKALRHDGLEMPRRGRLPDEVIADFAKWVDLGAPDPRTGAAPTRVHREIDVAAGRDWWAFRPLQSPALPDPEHPIDGLIRAAQSAQGLKPAGQAAREKLIRRACFDLTGLPPAPEQVAAFLSDESPQAFERLVDQLLASPAYGERWARHWLDAARFAESGGYEFDGFRSGAWHYRDWVIRSLNQDLPFDRFVAMQLAGDLLRPDDIEGAAATGFLVAGPYPGQITAKTVERIRYDQLDDMMMTIGGSMLGLTLGCVRCHEHKYDPIPHKDYYSVAASLATTVHGTRSLDLDEAATERALEKHRAELEPLTAALHTFAVNELPARFTAWREKELDKQPENPHWQILEPITLDAERSWLKSQAGGMIVHDGLMNPGASVRQRGQRRNIRNDESCRLVFHTHQKNVQSLRLDLLTDKSLPQRGPGLNADGSFQLTEISVTARPLTDPPGVAPADPKSPDTPLEVKLRPVFAAFEDENQPLQNAVDGRPGTAWVVKATAKKDNAAIFEFEQPIPGFEHGTELTVELKFRELGLGRFRLALSVEPKPATWAGAIGPQHAGELRAIAAASSSGIPEPLRVSLARWFAAFDSDTARVVRAVDEHLSGTPRPNLQEVYTTIAGGQDVFFLRRGEVDNKEGKAEPGYLQVLWRGPGTALPVEKSAADHPRVALARWISDVDQGAGPLLARVIVNRLWQHHFGKGIVGTPNDFGVQGEKPSHPELLEYLASELVRSGWKLKSLHRLIMLSDTWQQSHETTPENLQIDPTNKYLWHYQTRRLEAETIRDALLSAGGTLDATMYGPSVLDDSRRRSVYLRVKRSELLPVMTMFDAPEPTQSIGERSVTTVPTQALALMNSAFVRQQAEQLAARIRPDATVPLTSAVDTAYRIALGRAPTSSEQSRMLSFIQSRQAEAADSTENLKEALTEFCHVLLCLNEFIYID